MKIKKVVKPQEGPASEIKSEFDNTQFEVPTSPSSINRNVLIGGAGVFLILVLLTLYFFVFNNNKESDTKVKSNSSDYEDLKRKELELKERELKLREKQLNQSQQSGSIENYELDNEKEDIRNTVNNLLTAWQNKDVKGLFVKINKD